MNNKKRNCLSVDKWINVKRSQKNLGTRKKDPIVFLNFFSVCNDQRPLKQIKWSTKNWTDTCKKHKNICVISKVCFRLGKDDNTNRIWFIFNLVSYFLSLYISMSMWSLLLFSSCWNVCFEMQREKNIELLIHKEQNIKRILLWQLNFLQKELRI